MPKVGKKHYSYTPAGMAAAKKEATKTGKKAVSYTHLTLPTKRIV